MGEAIGIIIGALFFVACGIGMGFDLARRKQDREQAARLRRLLEAVKAEANHTGGFASFAEWTRFAQHTPPRPPAHCHAEGIGLWRDIDELMPHVVEIADDA